MDRRTGAVKKAFETEDEGTTLWTVSVVINDAEKKKIESFTTIDELLDSKDYEALKLSCFWSVRVVLNPEILS